MNTMKKLSQVVVAALLGGSMFVATSTAEAAVPNSVTHQGRLYNADKTPVEGTMNVSFRIYDQADMGNILFGETLSITFVDGYFSASLGDTADLKSALDGSVRYIGITVEGDTEMTPRLPMRSVPYAIFAEDVLGDIHPTSVSIGGTTVIDVNGDWVGNPTGLIGPMGPAGATGATGPAGEIGAAGPAGAIGATGATGAIGAMGPMGPIGPTGPMGPPGLNGQQGPTGPTGATGPAGPTGPAGASGTVGITGPAGPPGMGTNLLFTRAAAAFGDPVATKDALCVAEFGAAFQTASNQNVASLYRTEFSPSIAGIGSFTTSNYMTSMLSVSPSNGSAYFGQVAGASGSVACVRIAAPLQFTRGAAAFGDPVATKDALCGAEFGIKYRAASNQEVAANYASLFSPSIAGIGSFTTSNYTTSMLSVSPSNGSAYYGQVAGTSGSVACIAM